MHTIEQARPGRSLILALVLSSAACAVRADDPPKPESPLVKALKAGKVPEDRQAAVVTSVVKRGSVTDQSYILHRVIDAKGFSNEVRLKALEAFAENAITSRTPPEGDLTGLSTFLDSDDPVQKRLAIRLVGSWKVAALEDKLSTIAANPQTDLATRSLALESLAAIGDEPSRAAIRKLAGSDASRSVRIPAVAAMARFDPAPAADKAVELIRTADKTQDFSPVMAAFLNRQDGADLLASRIAQSEMPADNAKLALRTVYALGRADETLVAALSKAAGIESETRPPTKEEVDRMVAEVAEKGNPARGEQIFRRAELNCMSCHAISGAAGGVGPDLSSVGLSAPVEFVINSILVPDQAIKEQYHTLAVITTDGQVFQGIVADRDEQKVVLREANGDLRTIPTDEIEESKTGGSLMPKGLANLLTHDEFIDLVKFVSGLGKPGFYAVHTTPTIQRWRLMKMVPEGLVTSVPDRGAFVARVRDSDPSVWEPVYALADGALPVTEFSVLAGSPVLYLKGEIDLSAPGPVTFRFGSPDKLNAWIDDTPLRSAAEITETLDAGRHTLTIRVDTRQTTGEIGKIEVTRPPGSTAQLTVVGGR